MEYTDEWEQAIIRLHQYANDVHFAALEGTSPPGVDTALRGILNALLPFHQVTEKIVPKYIIE